MQGVQVWRKVGMSSFLPGWHVIGLVKKAASLCGQTHVEDSKARVCSAWSVWIPGEEWGESCECNQPGDLRLRRSDLHSHHLQWEMQMSGCCPTPWGKEQPGCAVTASAKTLSKANDWLDELYCGPSRGFSRFWLLLGLLFSLLLPNWLPLLPGSPEPV